MLSKNERKFSNYKLLVSKKKKKSHLICYSELWSTSESLLHRWASSGHLAGCVLFRAPLELRPAFQLPQ